MSNKNQIAWHKSELRKYLDLLKDELRTLSSDKIIEIENKIISINNFYNSFFEGDESLEGKVRNIESVIEQNEEKYKNIEEYHSKLLLSENSIKLEIEELLEELKGYKEKNLEINNYYQKLFEGDDNDEGIIDNINEVKNSIDEYKTKLFEGDDSLESKIDGLVVKIENYEEKYNGIIDYYKELLEGDDETESIKDSINNVFNEIKKYKIELLDGADGNKSIKEKINNTYSEIKKYYELIFGIKEEKDDEGKVLTKGIIGYKEKLEQLYTNKTTEYGELKTKIEGLLPGATSAGLSSAYKDMKDSFEVPKWIWSITFILSLTIIILLGKNIEVGEDLPKTLLNLLANSPYNLVSIFFK